MHDTSNCFPIIQPAQRKRGVELRTTSTHDTGLVHAERFTVLPKSDTIVMRGQKSEDSPWALQQYKLQGGSLHKLREVELPCEHDTRWNLLGMMVEREELLAAACMDCGKISLMNFETGETHVAYRGRDEIWALCLGEEGRMWVHFEGAGNVMQIRELNCSQKMFTETGRRHRMHDTCVSMCYLPSPHEALAISHTWAGWMEAVSCETGQQLWVLEGEVSGRTVCPRAVQLHPKGHTLLVGDWDNSRVLVLDPSTGHLVNSYQSTSQTEDLLWLKEHLLCFYASNICVTQIRDAEKGTKTYFFCLLFFSAFNNLCLITTLS